MYTLLHVTEAVFLTTISNQLYLYCYPSSGYSRIHVQSKTDAMSYICQQQYKVPDKQLGVITQSEDTTGKPYDVVWI